MAKTNLNKRANEFIDAGTAHATLVKLACEALAAARIDDADRYVGLIVEHLVGDAPLARELTVCETLATQRSLTESVAHRLLDESRVLIREQKNDRSVIASRAALLNSLSNVPLISHPSSTLVRAWSGLERDPMKVIALEASSVNALVSKPVNHTESEPFDPVAFRLMVKKFNEKWGALPQQKRVLLGMLASGDDGLHGRVNEVRDDALKAIDAYVATDETVASKPKLLRVRESLANGFDVMDDVILTERALVALDLIDELTHDR